MNSFPQPVQATGFLWDVERYERAVEFGIFTTEDPIELLDGELVVHARPQSSQHATAVQLVADVLECISGSAMFVRQQMPLRLGGASVPEPDVAVVRGSPRDYLAGHPRTAELVVEVADSSLAIDRGRKLRLYAREGVPEYWIVNLADDCVEVYRQPVGEAYAEVRTFRRGETIGNVGPRALAVAIADLLP